MSPTRDPKRSPLPRAIWALGFTSLLMDVSSEMVHGLLPLYITTVMGAGTVAVGLVEGIAEATALIVKIGSGAVSDLTGRRKMLALVGYGLAAVTKPLFPLAPTLSWIVAARFIDRIGKGIRGAPRDALVADLVEPARRGEAYGLRQSLDTVGAFLGPLIAIGLMLATGNAFTTVFWAAVIPAFGAVAVLAFFVPERNAPPREGPRTNPLARAALVRLPRTFWAVTAAGAILSMARISEAFLVLRATGAGLPAAWAPLVLVAMNIVYAAVAWPAGRLADRMSRATLLSGGILIYAAAALMLAVAPTTATIAAGVLLWGAHMAFTQGLMAAMVADSAPAEMRGTAFGMFNLASGIALLVGNVAAGLIWDLAGPSTAFAASALAALAAALAVIPLRRPARTG